MNKILFVALSCLLATVAASKPILTTEAISKSIKYLERRNNILYESAVLLQPEIHDSDLTDDAHFMHYLVHQNIGHGNQTLKLKDIQNNYNRTK